MVLTLYYCSPSPPARAALLAARAAGVDVTVKDIDMLDKEHLRPEYQKLNPQHTIPALKDDDYVIWDSHVIASYLVSRYAKDDSLYPKDLKKRALVDLRMYFEAGVLFPKIRGICFPVLFSHRATKRTVDEDLKIGIHEALRFLEKFLEGQTWVAGDTMTIADISCVSSVSSLVELGFDLSKYKNINAWLSLCEKEIPGYAEINVPGVKLLGQVMRDRLEPNQI